MLELIQRHLLGVPVVASPLIVGFLWCFILEEKAAVFWTASERIGLVIFMVQIVGLVAVTSVLWSIGRLDH